MTLNLKRRVQTAHYTRSKTMKMIFTLNLYSKYNPTKDECATARDFEYGAIKLVDDTIVNCTGLGTNVNKTLEFLHTKCFELCRKNGFIVNAR